jgi:maleate isomerase
MSDRATHPEAPRELAWLGDHCRRVGLVVPPSNPVAEPEMDALLGNDIVIYSDRLPRFDDLPLEERNLRYAPAYGDALDELAGLNLECALIAMTGPNYRLGLKGDRELCEELSARLGAPVATTSLATFEALAALGADRIHLVSPYPDWLTDTAVEYWSGAGIEVAGLERLLEEGEEFYAYETPTAEVVAHLKSLTPKEGAAVVISGTGLGSVAATWQVAEALEAPILSSDLCGAWWILSQCEGSKGSDLYRSIAPTPQ